MAGDTKPADRFSKRRAAATEFAKTQLSEEDI